MPLYCQNFIFWLPFWSNNSYCISLFLFSLLLLHAFCTPPFKYDSLLSLTLLYCLLNQIASAICSMVFPPLNFSDRLLWVCFSSFVKLIYTVPHWNPFLLIWEISSCPGTLSVQYNPPLYQSNKATVFLGLAFGLWFWQGFFPLRDGSELCYTFLSLLMVIFSWFLFT